MAIYPTASRSARSSKHYIDSGRTVAGRAEPTDPYGQAVYRADPDSYWRLGETTGTIAKRPDAERGNGIYSGGVSQGVTGRSPAPATLRSR